MPIVSYENNTKHVLEKTLISAIMPKGVQNLILNTDNIENDNITI